MTKFGYRARWAATGLLVLGPLFLTACDVKKTLLEPQQPGTITPKDIAGAGPAAAEALRVGALGWMKNWTGGGGSNGSNILQLSDLLTDVWKSGDTFSQHNETDRRVVQTNNSVLSTAYSDAQRSRGFFRDAIDALSNVPDRAPQIGEMYWGIGLVEMSMSELFCNGIPFGETANGVPTYTEPLTNQQGFALAVAHFDTALTFATQKTDAYSTAVRNAILVAKARTLVDMGKFAEAAALVPASTVPTNYQYTITFSNLTLSNQYWVANGQGASTARMVVGDSFDLAGIIKNAIPFASAKDPRVPVKGRSGVADSTKSIDRLTPYVQQQIWLNREDPLVIVSGIDARLIEAEAKLRGDDIDGMMTILNALRTSPQTLGAFKVPAMANLATPASKDAAIDLFFREKAFWQFARGTRLGDLRRLVRQYGRTQDKVFPTGTFHKDGGAAYGTDVNLPVTDTEKSNPNFKGCIDRNA